MTRITCGPPLGPIQKGQTNALNHCELLVDSRPNGLVLKVFYAASEEAPDCVVYEWRGLRPLGPRRLTWACTLRPDALMEHLEEALG